MVKSLKFLVLAGLFFACSEGQKTDKPLTSADSLNLKLVSQENVAYFGAPPLIPRNHIAVSGQSYAKSINGGQYCLDCHKSTVYKDEVPQTKHPERRNCVQCHIQDTSETATEHDFKVENLFKKYKPSY
ncbi:hypothetical protein IT568_02770 [bacterium]|nr:hypothetical protein [bacterium]